LEVEKDGNHGDDLQSFLPFSPNAEADSNLCSHPPAPFTHLSDNLLDNEEIAWADSDNNTYRQ
jgi:hypothetical protein